MAIVAGIAALHVCRVLSNGDDAIVTGAACPDNLGMINSEHWREYVRGMTVFTDVAGLYMGQAFARRFNAVVAVNATTGDIYMIEISR